MSSEREIRQAFRKCICYHLFGVTWHELDEFVSDDPHLVFAYTNVPRAFSVQSVSCRGVYKYDRGCSCGLQLVEIVFESTQAAHNVRVGLNHPDDVSRIRKLAVRGACLMPLLMLATAFTSVSRCTASVMLFRAHVSSTSRMSSVSCSCSAFTSAPKCEAICKFCAVFAPGSCTSCSSFRLVMWLERALKRLDIVSVLGELGCMCVDNFSEQVAVVPLVVVDCSVRADGRLAGVMH